jgi:lysophospholipase L1-like esterase
VSAGADGSGVLEGFPGVGHTVRMRGRVALSSLALVWACLGASPALAGESVVAVAPAVQPTFTATMPERFGVDRDADGLIDLPNTVEYVQNGRRGLCPGGCDPVRFTLRLDASASRATLAGAPLAITGYRWRITGPDGPLLTRSTSLSGIEVQLPEGTYRVALDVQAALGWGTATARVERQVVVEDLLIVAVGDSYASGEGNPERPRLSGEDEAVWADSPGDPPAEAAHAAAHRSTVAWPALAALALERADPATSVTFVSLAASGARVSRGLLAAQSGDGGPGQVGEVAALVGGRRIDALVVSIGGNDIGFSRIVRGLVDADPQLDPVCYRVDLENVWRSAADGDWNRGSGLRFALPWGIGCRETRGTGRAVLPGLQGLPAEIDGLAAAVGAGLDVQAVYLMEYPDPTGAAEGGKGCDEIVGDVTPPLGFHEIDTFEQAEGKARVLEPLNRLLAEAASRHGWVLVDGIAAAFGAGHGYCADPPDYGIPAGDPAEPAAVHFPLLFPEEWYRHPMHADLSDFLDEPGLSWYRTAAQSVALQEPGAAWDADGTLHPNELGHLAMAAALLEALGPMGG